MYLLNLEFETQIRLQTFCRNLHHKSRKYVNSVYLIYMQVKEISETKVEQCKSFFSDSSTEFEISFSSSNSN